MTTEPIDLLNEALRDVEDALDARKFGTSAEVDLDGENRLAWIRFEGGWLLAVKQGNVTDAMPRTELLKASRRLRLAAAGALPSLYAALQKAQDDHVAATVKATAEVRALADRIRAEARPRQGVAQDQKGDDT